MLDLVIRGGDVVDGTGAPRRRADVGVRSGRIVAVGDVDERARRVVDAEGRIVAPGFVDIHTHYDAQVFWDPHLTPSSLYGVTSVISGNCGFTIAPLAPEARDYLMKLLARVEGMPLESLETGVPWDWRTTAEYFDRFEHNLAVNVGFMVGHSTIRRIAMGAAATQRTANPDEVEAMEVLLRESLGAGGLGFSSSWGPAHVDDDGVPVPSRWADSDELVALAAVCKEFEGTSLEFIPEVLGDLGRSTDVMTRMSLAAQRPLNWNLIALGVGSLEDAFQKLEMCTHARERGGRVLAITMPLLGQARYCFRTGLILDLLPDWAEPMALSATDKLAMLRDPAGRRRLAEGACQPGPVTNVVADWGNRVITDTFSPETKRYEGRLVSDIAAEEGKSPFDALCDIVCTDELKTTFASIPVPVTDAEWAERMRVVTDERTLIGGSDAGAHLDFLSAFDLQASFLEQVVRQHQLMSLEEAIRQFTDRPAQLYGLRDRGRVAEGWWADLVVFDETTVGAGPVHTRFDLPGGAPRLYSEAVGINHVLVNGRGVVDGGATVDNRSGRLLRSGRDTYTAPLDA